MAPLPSPPFYHIPDVSNFRDAGGYRLDSPSNDSIRRGYLYRSAALHALTDDGKRMLRDELGVQTVFDLRSETEIEDQRAQGKEVVEVEGVQRVWAPVFEGEDYSPESIAERFESYAEGSVEGFTRAYASILSHGGPAFSAIFRHIIEHPGSPLLIHCTAGKDRTGVIVALILSIAGASDEVVSEEYALTEQGMGTMREMMVERLMERGLLGDREKAGRMVGARKEYMMGALAMIRETYGGPEGHARSMCGLSEEDVGRVRRNMRSDVAAVL